MAWYRNTAQQTRRAHNFLQKKNTHYCSMGTVTFIIRLFAITCYLSSWKAKTLLLILPILFPACSLPPISYIPFLSCPSRLTLSRLVSRLHSRLHSRLPFLPTVSSDLSCFCDVFFVTCMSSLLHEPMSSLLHVCLLCYKYIFSFMPSLSRSFFPAYPYSFLPILFPSA
jgi:hypothetical protein